MNRMNPVSAIAVDIASATHVVFESRVADRISSLGATNAVVDSDCLLVGPSRMDTSEHVLARQAWWGSFVDPIGADNNIGLVVVVWVSSTNLRERVGLWRVCGRLHECGIRRKDIVVVELDPPFRGQDTHESAVPTWCSASELGTLPARLSEARPWPYERYRRAVRLWSQYTAADPRPLAQDCARGLEGFPELAPLWAFLSSFFPRKTSDGALLLSRFDELLMTVLSAEWQTPSAMVGRDLRSGMDLWRMLSCTGDLFLPRRLEHWADHDASAVVERAPGPKPPNAGYPMLSEVYRLTERGMRLRDKGLDQLTDAPNLPIAGTEAYSASAPWVLLEDGRLARL
ncbi:hypothetical protein SOCE26_077190 [Sorangium cellulosum]|uniref:Uncharacterized protein n=1 Tax=Sorangium cellulosum TaxID=56 RepID=A0A2L0F3R1_SORCE|nr:hypothetical protein SOCE26_077190 [Sorangium cellulosum]